jgi:hypothetical protein
VFAIPVWVSFHFEIYILCLRDVMLCGDWGLGGAASAVDNATKPSSFHPRVDVLVTFPVLRVLFHGDELFVLCPDNALHCSMMTLFHNLFRNALVLSVKNTTISSSLCL